MVKEQKLKLVEKMKKEMEEYPVIGAVDLFKLPSKQFQQIKKKVRGQAVFRVMKKSILEFSFKDIKKKNIEEFKKIVPRQPAIVLTNMDPFKFYGMVDKLKSPSFAKEGDIAPADIKVSEGPTNLLPGPIIGELTRAGIPASVEEGKIVIKKEKVVVKKGDIISAPIANALKKLNIEPILIGLNILAIYQDGMIYGKDALGLVGERYINKLKEAFMNSLSLSITICYPTKENIGHLLSKAQLHAKAIENRFKIKVKEVVVEEKDKNEGNKENGGAK